MSRPVLAVAGVLDAVRRRAVWIMVAVGRVYDAAPGWVRRLVEGLVGVVVAAAAVGGVVVVSTLAGRVGVPVPPLRVWGAAGLVQLAVGGAVALALTTLDGEERADGRLPAHCGPARRGRAALVVLVVLAAVAGVLLSRGVVMAAPVPGAPPPAPVPAVTDLNQVITNIRNWLIGILAGVATLFFSLGGLRYMGANGDPAEVERAKGAFKSAGVGYALAILAPILLTALRSVVGG
ncbi:pilin [Frankia sp. BMG5.23]|uniref:pilin n=1 Tax=Frankia sp. BMG5.23 TaxID=683305 RepID=UPI001F44D821|nr:pilin [Frankia sp. BMG5.23]